MSDRAEPIHESKSAVNSSKTEDGQGVSQFQDNRPEASNLMQLQAMANGSQHVQNTAQLQATANNIEPSVVIQPKKNDTGLPDNLKSGIENLSGMSMDDVKVHRNSDKPAQLNAHAYAQGTDIHLASGQEKHLPHEAWHVVQQKQGRVKPTKQMKSKVNINDDAGLEREADVMGAKAITQGSQPEMTDNKSQTAQAVQLQGISKILNTTSTTAIQRKVYPPKPTHITAQQVEEWNAVLDNWPTEAAAISDWVQGKETTMWNAAFNYGVELAALKTQIRTQLDLEKIDIALSQNLGWDEMIPVIQQIEAAGRCAVTIAHNHPYDGGKGEYWKVQNTSGASQTGGWKYNAMKQQYLKNACSQVKSAIEKHNQEIDAIKLTV